MSRVRTELELGVSQSRGPGFETHPAALECWASSFTTRCLKSIGMLLVCPKRIAVLRSLNQRRKEAL